MALPKKYQHLRIIWRRLAGKNYIIDYFCHRNTSHHASCMIHYTRNPVEIFYHRNTSCHASCVMVCYTRNPAEIIHIDYYVWLGAAWWICPIILWITSIAMFRQLHQLTLFGEWDEILDLIFVWKVNTLTNLQPEVWGLPWAVLLSNAWQVLLDYAWPVRLVEGTATSISWGSEEWSSAYLLANTLLSLVPQVAHLQTHWEWPNRFHARGQRWYCQGCWVWCRHNNLGGEGQCLADMSPYSF